MMDFYCNVRSSSAVPARPVSSLLLALILIVLFALTSLRAEAACSQFELLRAARDVADARQILLALPVGKGDSEAVVPPGGVQAIRAMKDRLNELVADYMKCRSTDNLPHPDDVASDLARLASKFDRLKDTKDDDRYGTDLTFSVRSFLESGGLIGITAKFSVHCASDSILLVFSPVSRVWREVLRWQSKPYEEISGAFWSLNYAISPTNEHGNWYAVTYFISGWCASTWSGIHFYVLRPVTRSTTPKVLFMKSESIWWGGENYGHLSVDRRDFDLRFDAESIDTDILVRTYVQRYAVEGDSVYRIEPIALSPRDFVDEWMVSPWSAAKNWSVLQDLPALQRMHRKLSKLRSAEKTTFTFAGDRRCGNQSNAVQVELSLDYSRSLFFQINTNHNFRMVAVTDKLDSGCKGSNPSR